MSNVYRIISRNFSVSPHFYAFDKYIPKKSLSDFHKKKAYTPLKTPPMSIAAKKLGFKNKVEMYPEYPMEEPPKIWMIQQTKKLKGYPYWVKNIMKELGLSKVGQISLQTNSPKINDLLWDVKAVVKIQPVRFPGGLPTADDVGYTKLLSNGDFVINKSMKPTYVEDSIPLPDESDYMVVDGYRMCTNCKQKRCLLLGVCQKLVDQSKKNPLEVLGPRLFNFVENPNKKLKNDK